MALPLPPFNLSPFLAPFMQAFELLTVATLAPKTLSISVRLASVGLLPLAPTLRTIELSGAYKIMPASEDLVDSFRVADMEESLARRY